MHRIISSSRDHATRSDLTVRPRGARRDGVDAAARAVDRGNEKQRRIELDARRVDEPPRARVRRRRRAAAAALVPVVGVVGLVRRREADADADADAAVGVERRAAADERAVESAPRDGGSVVRGASSSPGGRGRTHSKQWRVTVIARRSRSHTQQAVASKPPPRP